MGIFSSLFDAPLVGLDIGTSGIKAVELSGKESPRLVAYNRIPLPLDVISVDGEIKKRDVLVDALRRLFGFRGFSSKRVAVGATGNAIITKRVTVNRMSESELRDQLYWEAEQYIPFSANEVNLDFVVLGNNNNASSDTPMMDVLIVAAKKDYVASLKLLIEEAGLTPAIIDNQSFALGNAFEFNYGHIVDLSPGGPMSILIDFGAGSTKLTLIEGDKTTFTRELRQSGLLCTRMISERLGVSIEEAEKLKIMDGDGDPVNSIINEFVESTVDEVSRTVEFCTSQNADASIQGIYICGGASKTFGLIEELESKLPAPLQPLNPVQNIAGSGKKMNAQAIRELSYLGGVAIGLSLRMAGDH